MEQLQHHGITGTVPKHVLSDNMKNFTAFPLSAPADDGFIHLLGKGICSFPNNCSMTFRINAPYHFFYVYEGTLSVTDEHHTCRLADRHAALLPISGALTIEILKGRCHYFHMYISGLALLQFHTLLPSPLAYPAESSSMFTLFHTMEHLQNLQKDTFNDPLSVCRISMWITNILTEMAVYSAILPRTGIRSRIICGKFIIYLTHNTEKIIHWTNWKIRIPSANTGSAASFLNTMGLLLSST